MSSVYLELRSLREGRPLSTDIAQHLYARQMPGLVIVLADNPIAFRSALAKQWYRLVAKVEREKSSTLNITLRQELEERSVRMRTALPSKKSRGDYPFKIEVVDEVDLIPNNCHTLYIVSKLGEDAKQHLLEHMPQHSLVVQY